MLTRLLFFVVISAPLLGFSQPSPALQQNEDSLGLPLLDLSTVTVTAKKHYTLNELAAFDLKLRPVNSSQDILRVVSGLFIAQHAGGGKAEQIFLRGYDIDHGTDINISVDGIPVNMVSHAHGQGYADLHFLIPETVDKANFDKGPFFANKGNLATAGFVEFQTKNFIEKNSFKIQAGQFNTRRLLGMLKIFNKEKDEGRQQLYLAGEYHRTDGYFDLSQDFHRLNLMAKYTAQMNNNWQVNINASHLDSKWNASGQVPQRAIDMNLISRFGAIDSSEGGDTRRTNYSAKLEGLFQNGWKSSSQVYISSYQFNLFSNFSFFLNDPLNGDEINQKEKRILFGYHGNLLREFGDEKSKARSTIESGWGFRADRVSNSGLDHVKDRQYLETFQNGKIRETNIYAYLSDQLIIGSKFSFTAGIRFDQFLFQYRNLKAGATRFSKQGKSVLSPKFNFTYSPHQKLKLYLHSGIGFHSNDTRVILDQQAEEILPKVFGTDLGLVLKPNKNLVIKTVFWFMHAQQEFIYVGDEGIVEPGGRTRRIGIDFSGRYQFRRWLFADLDINAATPRLLDEAKGSNYVPLAPTLTSIGGLTIKTRNNFNGSLRYRLISDRPGDENKSVIASGYFLLDAVFSYPWKNIEFSLSAENLLDAAWKEAQFDTQSRMRFESQPVSEIHFTPGSPRFIKAGITISF